MFIEAPALTDLPKIRHAFFTRQGGVSEGIYASLNGGIGSSDDAEHVKENRRRMAETVGVAPDALISVYQVHSPDAVLVEGPWRSERPKADAMVTKTPGLALAITTADCGPVLFADHEAGVIGAAHAGWRGAVTGVLESTLDAMERLGAKRSRIVAVLGPDDQPEGLRGRPRIRGAICRGSAGPRALLPRLRQAGTRHVRPARLHRRAA